MNATITIFRLANLAKILTLRKVDTEFICIIDDKDNPVKLKDGCIDLLLIAMQKNPQAGMIYADYDIVTKNKVEEIHLLKHHIGRVRDNQDYGKVFLFRKSFLKQVGGFDENLKYNYLYDIRLKLSEVSEIVHIANKKGGALYQVT